MAREAMLEYDWDKIVEEKWIPFFDKVHEELYSGKQKVWAEGKVFNIRGGTFDHAIIDEVIHKRTYSQHLKLDKDDVVLDIGGQIGTFSIDIAGKVSKVYTYEPDKDNFEFLKKNIEENKIENIFANNKAVVGNEDKERTLFKGNKFNGAGNNTGGYSLIDCETESKDKVHCENINAIIKSCGITKIKMDCEGSEYEIIKSADLSSIKELIFEYHFNLLGMAKYEELLEYLKKYFVVAEMKMVYPHGQTIVYCKKLTASDSRKEV
jgi:FkbM family methyltransferase